VAAFGAVGRRFIMILARLLPTRPDGKGITVVNRRFHQRFGRVKKQCERLTAC
jgi:hypothetical protein